MNILSLTTPITFTGNISPAYAYLHHCKTFLSPDFHGRKVKVIEQKVNGTLIINPSDRVDSDLSKLSKMLLGVLKIIGWMTVILPILAYFGALIFHAYNVFAEELIRTPPPTPMLTPAFAPALPAEDPPCMPALPPAPSMPVVDILFIDLPSLMPSVADCPQPPPPSPPEIHINTTAGTTPLPEEEYKISAEESSFILENPLNTREKCEAYIYLNNPGMPIQQAQDLIDIGLKMIKSLKHPDLILSEAISQINKKEPRELQSIIAGLSWYCMFRAIDKGMGFKEGSFMIPDPNHTLHTFLSSLHETYQRISSHLKSHTPKMHAGIDIETFPLPGGSRHLLFAPVIHKDGSSWIFIKPEDHGTKGVVSLIAHTFGWFQSIGRLYLPSVFGSNEEVGVYKERIPEDTVKEFRKLVAFLPGGEAAIKLAGEKGAGEGISAMHRFITDYIDEPNHDPLIKEQLLHFRTEYLDRYDNLHVRIGQEVILDQFWENVI